MDIVEAPKLLITPTRRRREELLRFLVKFRPDMVGNFFKNRVLSAL